MERNEEDFEVFAVPGPPIVVSRKAWEKRPRESREEFEARMKEIHEISEMFKKNNLVDHSEKPKVFFKKKI